MQRGEPRATRLLAESNRKKNKKREEIAFIVPSGLNEKRRWFG